MTCPNRVQEASDEPTWDGLLPDHRHPPQLDWGDFRAWLLAERGLRPRTVQNTMRAIKRLSRAGINWRRFLMGPQEARATVRPFLAHVAGSAGPHAVCEYQKTLNRLAWYLADVIDPAFEALRFRLTKVPSRHFDPYTADELRALLDYRTPNPDAGARRRCMLWLCFYLAERTGQIHGFRVSDFDPRRGAVAITDPVKGGEPRWENVPSFFWDPSGVVQEWLLRRERILDRAGTHTDAFWITTTGRPLSYAGFRNEIYRIGKATGVKANFNRFRHTRGSIWDALGGPTRILSREWGHHGEDPTRWYMRAGHRRRADVLAKVGAPGFAPGTEPNPGDIARLETLPLI